MSELHISPSIVEGATRRRTKKIDQELLFSRKPIIPAMRPKATQLWIVHQTGHEVVGHGSNSVVSSVVRRAYHPSFPVVFQLCCFLKIALVGYRF